ncbi:glycogen debranching protein [Streptomyces sp. NPDC026672]|uniref:amylo-alpha-1,6-glucosidase n=1 Tax=unclassified Streptomyces TaxID=2593676 RepID=UPI003401B7FA
MVMGTTADLFFDPRRVPFSRRGAWFNLSPVVAPHTVADHLHLVAHQHRMTPVLELVPLDARGVPVTTRVTGTPSLLRWEADAGHVEAVYESARTLRLRGEGLGFALRDGVPEAPFAGSHFFTDPVDGAYVFSSHETGVRFRVTVLRGTATTGEAPGSRTGVLLSAAGPWEVAVEELGTARRPYRPEHDFDTAERHTAAEFRAFADAVAGWRTDGTPAAEAAAHVLWSAMVRPDGFVTREAALMSKHWMDRVWSWDNCFNALALAPGLPGTALDQLRLLFDHQDESGALPDLVGHSLVSRAYVKPPVHGWAFARLRALLPPLTRDELGYFHERLARLTDFWLTSRRVPGHRLAHYQHGNDSGWDNATVFADGAAMETPDLATLLVLQLRVLHGLAVELDDDRAGRWAAEARDMTDALLTDLWDGADFTSLRADDGTRHTSRSLLRLLPVVAGDVLGPEVTARLAHLVAGHLTPHGLATEHTGSPAYEADGYWRGPVWGPPTVLVEQGLRTAGFTERADTLSASFRRLCETSGFAENFDALTGEGLRDRAYTWTAACYLLLAREHVERERSAHAAHAAHGTHADAAPA